MTLVALGNGAADIFAAIASERFQKAKMVIWNTNRMFSFHISLKIIETFVDLF